MCGIAGSVCWNNVENAEYNNIKKIISALNHRGPDFSSVKNFGRANIGHARLSIIDLNKKQTFIPYIIPNYKTVDT